ncbi:hypothetical protein E1301_Tti012002 [Triplophysa tibetana]|uniref:Uncharacterized protein n=1 Tax=Triplophysa tibetana TaxID=1572043 RepID=A0A5A9PJE7_9TELE|nr:hypothetical protein E1301_Tti012002 [Triplophysa tibetana]
MSVHEFLREGQDAPQRILSRLSQLLYNLSATVLQGVPFSPFTSFSRKSSWKDWNDAGGYESKHIFKSSDKSGGPDIALCRQIKEMGVIENNVMTATLTPERERKRLLVIKSECKKDEGVNKARM